MERKKRDKKKCPGLLKQLVDGFCCGQHFWQAVFQVCLFPPNLGLGSAPEGRVYAFLTIFIGVVNQQETEQRGTNRNF